VGLGGRGFQKGWKKTAAGTRGREVGKKERGGSHCGTATGWRWRIVSSVFQRPVSRSRIGGDE